MTQGTPENPGPVESRPGDNPDAPTDPESPLATTPDTTALQPEDVRTQPPDENKGSGNFAVWDNDLGQYVSGVSSKADASKALKGLEAHNGAITDGHSLEVREV